MHAHKHTHIYAETHTHLSHSVQIHSEYFCMKTKIENRVKVLRTFPLVQRSTRLTKKKDVIGIIALLFLKQYQFIKKHI